MRHGRGNIRKCNMQELTVLLKICILSMQHSGNVAEFAVGVSFSSEPVKAIGSAEPMRGVCDATLTVSKLHVRCLIKPPAVEAPREFSRRLAIADASPYWPSLSAQRQARTPCQASAATEIRSACRGEMMRLS